MNTFLSWLRRPIGRVLVSGVLFAYLNAAVGVSYPRAQLPVATQGATPGADYRVGPGDHLFLSVPGRQDLNRELILNERGEVSLPLVGNVGLSGLTAGEIEVRLLQAMREYYPSVKTVEVVITRTISNIVFVSGDVKIPGKYSFTESMNVWEAIREAGGPTPSAALTNVRIVQDRSRGGQSFIVDVQAALDGGSVDNLPILKPGDTVLVPAKAEVYTGTSGINVFGAVVRPGAYPLQSRQDLMSALMVAGGPTERAKLGEVRIVRPNADGTATTMEIDLDRFLKKGDMANNPRLLSGDTVHIGNKALTAQNVSLVLGFITALGTAVLLYYTIQREVDRNSATN